MKLLSLAFAAGLLIGAFSPAEAAPVTVAVFDNGSFVDTSGGFSAESDTVQASLTSLGHTVLTFTGFDAASWAAAAASADLILIPELENGNLAAALSPAAEAAIATAVSGGTGFVVMGSSGFLAPRLYDRDLLNNVFGYSLVDTQAIASTSNLNAANAAGTMFAGGPASLPPFSATLFFQTASLPAGALAIYDFDSGGGPGTGTTVFTTTFGGGIVGYVGWDWFDAQPIGSNDGGWLQVLDSMAMTAGSGAAVPEPSSLLLLAAAGGIVALARRRRRT